MLKYFLAIFWLLVPGSWLQASAAQFKKIYVNSGTGFLVTRDGHIVTNNHVLHECKRIVVTGATRRPYDAEIIARDHGNDLALLKIETMGATPGEFSAFRQPLQEGDRVLAIGYPGAAAKTMRMEARETTILNTKGPQGEDKWIQLGNVIEQGNSGGPLLDGAGNVVGVVSAKVMTYTYRKDAPQEGTTRLFGVAVAVPVVLEFLDKLHVRYRVSDAEPYLSTDRIADSARQFVVNVQCQYRIEISN